MTYIIGIEVPERDNSPLKKGDVTNCGIIENITMAHHYVIDGKVVGNWQNIKRIQLSEMLSFL